MPPVRREQPDVFLLGKPVVQQKHRTSVFRRADHAPCGLQYLVHAGIAVGIIKSKAVLCVIITAQHFLLRIYLRQAHTHNGAPDQAAACKINSLTKDAAHHAKTQKCFGRVRHKLSQKFSPSGIIQTAFLHKGANARVTCCKIFVYLPQICVAWEKGKVVSRSGLHQLGQWILLPRSVRYSVSSDNADWTPFGQVEFPEDQSVPVKFVPAAVTAAQPVRARYVKVEIEGVKTCPPWHYGVGCPCWFFLDEVTVK